MKTFAQFIASTLIFVLLQLPMMLISFFVVPFMLLTKWDGRTTWFGNFKYGRGDTHYKAPSNGEYWRQYTFLCWRNPVSNFGKLVLCVKVAPWVWLHDVRVVRSVYFKWGWKLPSGEMPGMRTFVWRPYIVKLEND